MHCIALHCITLHYITLHYIHYITLHYITLHYITLHYIHTYIHTYIDIHTYIHTYIDIHTYIHTYIHIIIYICMYVCIYICIHTYTYTHTHIQSFDLPISHHFLLVFECFWPFPKIWLSSRARRPTDSWRSCAERTLEGQSTGSDGDGGLTFGDLKHEHPLTSTLLFRGIFLRDISISIFISISISISMSIYYLFGIYQWPMILKSWVVYWNWGIVINPFIAIYTTCIIWVDIFQVWHMSCMAIT